MIRGKAARILTTVGASLVLALSLAKATEAEYIYLEHKQTASDAVAGAQFGYSVSINGSVMAVGSIRDNENGINSGSAYVYRYDGNNWVEEQKLLASDAAAGDFFGASVAVNGDVIVVGAFLDNGTGSAYVFRYNGSSWIEEQKLLASDAAVDDDFGLSVSVSGDVIIVGAYGCDNAGPYTGAPNAGSAYIYRYNGSSWIEEQKLYASDAYSYDYFGSSVSVSGDIVAVGAYQNDDNGNDSGSAYVFRYGGGTWTEEQKLAAGDAAAGDNFGRSISVSGDALVVGANLDDDGGSGSGSAYVFRYGGGTWSEEQKLVASDAAADDRFGRSVSVSGDMLVVGAYSDDDGGSASGSAYVFRYGDSTWMEDQKLLAGDAAADDYFGFSVSVDGQMIAVGAYRNDDAGSESGSVYVYEATIDADKDGLPNDWETANGLDPYNPLDAFIDGDADGLTSLEEYTLGTDPQDSDTDNDGVSDGFDGYPLNDQLSLCMSLIRNNSTHEVFPSVRDAIIDTNASDYDIIQITAADFIEDILYERYNVLTLSGGYYCNFSDNPSTSSISSLTVRNGTVILDNMVIK